MSSETLNVALNRSAVALSSIAGATNDTSHNLAAQSSIAGRERNTFFTMFHTSGSDAPGAVESQARYFIRGVGNLNNSSVGTHMALLGEASFFLVKDSNDNLRTTRVGTFSLNNELKMQNHLGAKLLYVPIASDGTFPSSITRANLDELSISNLDSSGKESSLVQISAGLNGNIGSSVTKVHNVYDASGTARTIQHTFTRIALPSGSANQQAWRLTVSSPSGSTVAGDATNPYGDSNYGLVIEFNNNKPAAFRIGDGSGGFGAAFTDVADVPKLKISWPATDGLSDSNFELFLGDINSNNGLQITNSGQSFLKVKTDGYGYGTFLGMNIDKNGLISAKFDNATQRVIGKIPVGTVNNPDHMILAEDGYLDAIDRLSGELRLKYFNESGIGGLATSALEGSTIDVTKAMTNMITREHQTNSIATSMHTINRMWSVVNKVID